MGSVRPAEERDRAALFLLLGRDTALDQPQHHPLVYEDDVSGRILGASTLVVPAGGDPRIGAVQLRDATRLDVFHALVVAVVQAAVDAGFEFGEAPLVRDRAVLSFVRTFYAVEPEVTGRDGATGDPIEWRFRVHLPSTLARITMLPPPTPGVLPPP